MDTLYDIYQFLQQHAGATTISSFLIAVAVEKSKTIKFNPFSFIGDLLTGRVMDKVYESQGNLLLGVKDDLSDLREEISSLDERLSKEVKQYRDENAEQHESLINEMKRETAGYYMKQKRIDMFRFEEGIRRGVVYTKEHWHNMRNTAIEYEKFCEENEWFINSECENAIRTIKEIWETHPWEKRNDSTNKE